MNKLSSFLTQKTAMVFGVLTILGVQGCADGTSHVEGITSPDPIDSITVSGTAVKGVVANADCVVYGADQTTVLYTSVDNADPCTDENGDYSIQLTSEPSGPVIVELLPRTGTTMLCDFPDGCGSGVAFGQTLNLGATFSLRAVVPSVSDATIEVNITPWSDAAASRAIAQAGTGGTVTAAQASTSIEEIAAVLNNILDLESASDSDKFGSDLLSIDPVNLASPSDVDSGEAQKGSLLSLASSSLFDLIDTGSNTSIEAVISNLSSAFEDGEFNVNDTAANIASDNGIDLADILTGIAEVATDLTTVLDDTAEAVLDGLLGDDLDLTEVATDATSFAEQKNDVTDQELDLTAPAPVDTSTSAADKTKQMALDLDNVLAAGLVTFADFDESGTTIIEELDELFEISTTDIAAEMVNLGHFIEAGSEMILANLENETSMLTNSGCTSESGTITCTLAQASTFIEEDMNPLSSGTGNLVLTTSTNTVVTSNALLSSDEYQLSMSNTTFSDSTITHAITLAAIDFDNNSDTATDVSLGSTTTVTIPLDSNEEATFITVDANDVSIILSDEYSYSGSLLLTRDLSIRDTVLSSFVFDGVFTILRASDSPTSNQGETADMSLRFTTSTTSLASGSSIPTFDGDNPEETSSNFFTISNAIFNLSLNATYNKSTLANDGSVSRSSATELFSVRVSGDRTALDVTDLSTRIALVSSGSTRSVSGTVVLVPSTDTETYTLSNGSATAVVTASTSGLTGTLSVDGTATGTINSSGAVTVTSTSESIQLGAWLLD